MGRMLYHRILGVLHLRQWLCQHHFWPYIADDGMANYIKCGKCGLKIPTNDGKKQRHLREIA